MLGSMRDATKNWLGKIVVFTLFGLLILSFAVWGVGDMFTGFGSGTVAKAGKVEITTENYRAEFQTTLQNLQRELQRPITNRQAREEGIDRMVLNRMIAEALVDRRARELGLALDDATVAGSVLNDPQFRAPSGAFDRVRFQQALSQAGLNEARFMQQQRSLYLRQQLGNSLAGETPVPRAMLEVLHALAMETRSVEYLRLDEAAAGDVPAPSDEALQKFFEARKGGYRAPEYRTVVVLSVTPASIADPSTVSEEDARQLYEAVRDQRYTTPERRQVQQIVFGANEQAEAEAALKRIRDGADFEEIAKERNLSPDDIALGTLARADFIDPAIAAAAFALQEGQIGEVVVSRFGPALVRVTAIEPQSVREFDAVRDELKKEIAERQAADRVQELYTKVENERTSGKILEEAAKAVGLDARTIEAIDRTGLDKEREPVADLPERQRLLEAVFESDIGVDNDTISAAAGGYIWFEVTGIDAPRDRTLDEVREEVETAWRDQEVARILREKGEEIVKKVEAGQSLTELAKAMELNTEVAPDVRRAQHPRLPRTVVDRAFAIPVGGSATAPGGSRERFVFTVLDSATPPLVDRGPDMVRVEEQLQDVYRQEIFEQYVDTLRKGLTITYNQTALRNVLGDSN